MGNNRKEFTEKFAIKGLSYSLILLGLIAILSIFGCKKQNNTSQPVVVDCYCGDVTLVSIWYSTTGGSDIYKYESRNNCTNAPYRFETQTRYTDSKFCLNYQW